MTEVSCDGQPSRAINRRIKELLAAGQTEINVQGSAGWGLAESMQSGTVTCRGNAGNAVAASIRGGTVIVHGDAAARAGVSMKGGLLVIGGNTGYMTGFMAQKGTIIVCGDAAEGFGDSMYACTTYVGGRIAELGSDAVLAPLLEEDVALLESTLAGSLPKERRGPVAREFKKVVAGGKLWNFDHRDWETWREAL
jgi:formylmethanofuran dehydrogenase subunit C